jgi:hypothetical protein
MEEDMWQKHGVQKEHCDKCVEAKRKRQMCVQGEVFHRRVVRSCCVQNWGEGQ